MRRVWWTWLVLWSGVLALGDATDFSIETAVVTGASCSSAGQEIARGLQFALSQFNATLSVIDRAGIPYNISFRHQLQDNSCSRAVHRLLVTNTVQAGGAHFAFGSEFSEDESALYNAAGRMVLHCCAPDAVYERNLPYVLGVQTPWRSYSLDALRLMLLYGNASRIAVAYRTDDSYSSAVCEGAVAYLSGPHNTTTARAAPPANLTQIQPRRLVSVLPYNAASTGSSADAWTAFYRSVAQRAIAAGADAFVGCDTLNESGALVAAFYESKHYLKGTFVSTGPAVPSWVSTLGVASDGLLSAVQWHPAMGYTLGGNSSSSSSAGSSANTITGSSSSSSSSRAGGGGTADVARVLGSTADYTARYVQAYGEPPTARAAAASAAVMTLAAALATAFSRCDLSRARDADELLFARGVLACDAPAAGTAPGGSLPYGPLYGNVTGYELVYAALQRLRIDSSFFGPVQLDERRRNAALPAATVQVSYTSTGSLAVILPMIAANGKFIMPARNRFAVDGVPLPPSAGLMPRGGGGGLGSLNTVGTIVVSVLSVVVFGLLVMLGLVFLRRRQRRKRKQPLEQLVAIKYADLTDIRAPVQVMSGYPPDYETGYAKLKGQYVALRPLVDYYAGRLDKNSQLQGEGFLWRGNLVYRSRQQDREGRESKERERLSLPARPFSLAGMHSMTLLRGFGASRQQPTAAAGEGTDGSPATLRTVGPAPGSTGMAAVAAAAAAAPSSGGLPIGSMRSRSHATMAGLLAQERATGSPRSPILRLFASMSFRASTRSYTNMFRTQRLMVGAQLMDPPHGGHGGGGGVGGNASVGGMAHAAAAATAAAAGNDELLLGSAPALPASRQPPLSGGLAAAAAGGLPVSRLGREAGYVGPFQRSSHGAVDAVSGGMGAGSGEVERGPGVPPGVRLLSSRRAVTGPGQEDVATRGFAKEQGEAEGDLEYAGMDYEDRDTAAANQGRRGPGFRPGRERGGRAESRAELGITVETVPGPEPPAKDAIKSAAQLFRTTATEASTTYVAGAEDLPSLAFPPPPGAAPVVPSFASAPPHAHMILSSGARTGPVPRSATVAALDAASFSTSAAVAAAAVAAATVSSGANRHELSLAAGHSAAEHSQDSVLPPNDGYIAPAPTDELHTLVQVRGSYRADPEPPPLFLSPTALPPPPPSPSTSFVAYPSPTSQPTAADQANARGLPRTSSDTRPPAIFAPSLRTSDGLGPASPAELLPDVFESDDDSRNARQALPGLPAAPSVSQAMPIDDLISPTSTSQALNNASGLQSPFAAAAASTAYALGGPSADSLGPGRGRQMGVGSTLVGHVHASLPVQATTAQSTHPPATALTYSFPKDSTAAAALPIIQAPALPQQGAQGLMQLGAWGQSGSTTEGRGSGGVTQGRHSSHSAAVLPVAAERRVSLGHSSELGFGAGKPGRASQELVAASHAPRLPQLAETSEQDADTTTHNTVVSSQQHETGSTSGGHAPTHEAGSGSSVRTLQQAPTHEGMGNATGSLVRIEDSGSRREFKSAPVDELQREALVPHRQRSAASPAGVRTAPVTPQESPEDESVPAGYGGTASIPSRFRTQQTLLQLQLQHAAAAAAAPSAAAAVAARSRLGPSVMALDIPQLEADVENAAGVVASKTSPGEEIEAAEPEGDEDGAERGSSVSASPLPELSAAAVAARMARTGTLPHSFAMPPLGELAAEAEAEAAGMPQRATASSLQLRGSTLQGLVAGGGGGGGGGAPTSQGTRRLISSKRHLAHIIWRLTRLQHPNVLPVLGIVWDFAGLPVPVLVTQYEEFGSLAGLLDNSTVVIDRARRVDIVNDVANALRYLYAQDDLIFNGLLGATNWRVYLDKRFKAKVEVTIASIALESPVFTKGRGSSPAPQQPPPHWGSGVDGLDAAAPPTGVLSSWAGGRGAAEAAAVAATLTQSAEPDDVYQFGLMVLALFVDTPVSLLGPTEEQLEAVRALHPVLAEVVDMCTAPDADARPSFADIVPQLAKVHLPEEPPADRLSLAGGSANRGGVLQMTDEQLLEAFPPSVAAALLQGKEPPAEPHEEVSIFFSDIVGYTNHCSRLATHEVMDMLNRLYTRFDAIIKELELFKVDVIGDAYLAVGNIRVRHPDSHARRLAEFALRAVQVANSEPVCVTRPELGTISIRVGLHVGPVMACVVGTMNRRYSLFGNTVNVASRMESTSEPNKVQCTTSFKQLVKRQWPQVLARSRGFRNIKGKGLMETYFLYPPGTPSSTLGPSVLNEELALSSRASSEANLAQHLAHLNLKRFQSTGSRRGSTHRHVPVGSPSAVLTSTAPSVVIAPGETPTRRSAAVRSMTSSLGPAPLPFDPRVGEAEGARESPERPGERRPTQSARYGPPRRKLSALMGTVESAPALDRAPESCDV